MRRIQFLWSVAILFLSVNVSAQEIVREGKYWIGTFSKSFAVAQQGVLEISQVTGDVIIKSWDRGEVKIQGRLKMDIPSEKEATLAFTEARNACLAKGDTVEIQGRRFARNWISARLEISVPKQFACDISLRGGSITATGIGAPVDVKTDGGTITLTDILGPCKVATAGGPITLIRIGKEVTASSGGGPLDISQVKGEITATTGGGEIRLAHTENGASLTTGGGIIDVEDCHGEIRLRTGGGDITASQINGALHGSTGGGTVMANQITGSVELRTGGGNIMLNKISGAIHARSGSGNIEAECLLKKLKDDQTMQLQTENGNITLSLSSDISCTIDAQIRSGGFEWQSSRITSDFPLSINSTDNRIHASGKVNSGGPTIWLETRDGNIQIRKRD